MSKLASIWQKKYKNQLLECHRAVLKISWEKKKILTSKQMWNEKKKILILFGLFLKTHKNPMEYLELFLLACKSI